MPKKYTVRVKHSRKLDIGDTAVEVYPISDFEFIAREEVMEFRTVQAPGLDDADIDSLRKLFAEIVGIPVIITNYPFTLEVMEVVEVAEEPNRKSRFDRDPVI